ncbi:MAG TPA: YcaO-like family protein [Allosphingosinicella sp.]|nr:YcaO-like family protein [Allosphingosinicella sp.]
MKPGPAGRAAAGESPYLKRLRDLAGECGVTRLADITRLDEIGIPVWQAIRPAGRSLSVHQGKGRSALDAKIGALSEAIEAHSAEEVAADGPHARVCDLPPDSVAARLCDYSRWRHAAPPRGRIAWCSAADVRTGKTHYLPHALVSLDFTRPCEPWFERSSTGLGAGPDEAAALRTALCELVERDAVGEWERSGTVSRIERAVGLDTVPFGWFQELRQRVETLGASIRLFAPEAAIELPVLACWIEGPERFGSRWRRFGGSGADGDPEIALYRAVAEAAQSRLTFIAAVRDDMLPSAYRGNQAPSEMRLPPVPPGFDPIGWSEIPGHGRSAAAIVEALSGRGYRQIVSKRLDGGMDGVAVVKAFVPGLGSLSRTRAP